MKTNVILFKSHKQLYSKYFTYSLESCSLKPTSINHPNVETILVKCLIKAAWKYSSNILKLKKNQFEKCIDISLAKEISSLLDIRRKNIFFIGTTRYKPYNLLYNRLISILNNGSWEFYDIDMNIVLQGSGNLKDEFKTLYSDHVKSLYVPSPKPSVDSDNIDSFYRRNNAKLFFMEDNYSPLNFNESSHCTVIFHGYDKQKRLYPHGVFEIIKIIAIMVARIRRTDQKRLILLLHPRISYISPCLNLFLKIISISSLIKVHDLDDFMLNQVSIDYFKVVSFSPTVSSNLLILERPNIFFMPGKDCTISTILEIMGL